MKRNTTRKIHVGHVPIGGDAPIAVQSMTNTDTRNISGSIRQ
ncbi:MAG: flavodoxin-dependent (E)-4-hydroxy-3-methylbut-2-enyl-diphosphate synthase, partial [Deltaproteobacteria bacterium]|nr:flavodoxin-dependent (E)-4-hydroxy-3-methylbut-2-enyl-diphosphate synthase [Deltaproteobacteria bacterium]